MLERIKYILAYLQWFLLIGFVITFGIQMQQNTIIGAIIIYLSAIILGLIMINFSNKKYSASHKIVNTVPMTTPIMSIISIICCIQFTLEPNNKWIALVYFILPICIVDLIRWYLIIKYNNNLTK